MIGMIIKKVKLKNIKEKKIQIKIGERWKKKKGKIWKGKRSTIVNRACDLQPLVSTCLSHLCSFTQLPQFFKIEVIR
jgi:hypothetical protein